MAGLNSQSTNSGGMEAAVADTEARASNKNIVSGIKFFEDMLGKADWKLADQLVAKNVVMHHPSSPEPVVGADNVIGFLAAFRAGFPDMSMKVEIVFGAAEMVAVRWRMNGTHTAELFGIPASGKSATVVGISLLRFSNGKVIEDWVSEDSLGLMQQIGVIPPTG